MMNPKDKRHLILGIAFTSMTIIGLSVAIMYFFEKGYLGVLLFIVPMVLFLAPRYLAECRALSRYGKSTLEIEWEQKDPVTGSDMVVFRNFMSQKYYIMVIFLASIFGAGAVIQKSIVVATISYLFAIAGSYAMFRFWDKMKPTSKK